MSIAFTVCCVKEMDGVLGVGRENEKKKGEAVVVNRDEVTGRMLC